MLWIFFLAAGTMTALVTATLIHPLMLSGQNKRIGRAVLIFLPCMALATYLPFGQPEWLGESVPVAHTPVDLARARNAMLAQKPLETLRRNPQDVGSLIILGDLSVRLGRHAQAEKLYARAEAAMDKDDPRLIVMREKRKLP